ncbi:uncharacterized protein E5676_scaffold129G00780 [Cucumis melo var. makuwa]|uniref:Retrotransposon gag domain-containing protein n=1 Tax=Cucumis melo var. makuwa TaxID=1194695 RepID=A0A5D3E0D8_CUCMM|nr:uncharacterized protein E6C27_scaffold110G001930 [Cucumis melo var. makuwa]TYK29362.1 uncharacterized protein E5676_scaffold129G00780 [Cucumis melo var. makuwa]
MLSENSSGKTQKDRLVELEEQMLYLVEVPDSIRFLESRLKEISEKADTIDAVAGHVEDYRYKSFCSLGFVTHLKERVNELYSSQKIILEMINGMLEDFRATLDVVRNEIRDVNTRLNLTMDAKALENFIFDHEQYFKATNTVIEEAKVTLATMHLCEDAKLWWRSRYMDIQEGHCTIDTWDVLKKELRSQFFPENVEILARAETVGKDQLYEQRVQDLTLTYAAAKLLFDLINDSQDVRRHQSFSPERNRNSCLSSPKDAWGGKHSGRDRMPYQPNTENTWRRLNNRSLPKHPLSCFICEGPHLARECSNKADFHAFQASLTSDSDDNSNQVEGEVDQIEGGEKTQIGAIKYLSSLQKNLGERSVPIERGLLGRSQTSKAQLGEGFRKNEGREFRCPTYCRTGEMNDDKVGRMERPRRLCGYLSPTVVQADIRQPNRFKMISTMQLDNNPAQEEPPSMEIPLGALGKMGETVPKDTLCVLEKYHGVMPKSWPKSLSMQRMIDHGIEFPSEAKTPTKNAYRMTPPKLAVLRK